MQIVATHANTDFDALASLVAATFLYDEAVGVLPNQLHPNVKKFLALHRELFRLIPRKDLDLGQVSRLIVVDTNSWSRLDRMQELSERADLEILLWDHHMKGGDIRAAWKCHEEIGATITLMLREIKARDAAFAPMHATLFLMGLYEDTGHLTYPSVTAEDIYAAGFLVENGADLNVAAAYLSSVFDSEHMDVLTKMLESSEVLHVGGSKIGIALVPVESGATMLASVVTKFREISGVDAAIGIFCIHGEKCMVIGRAGSNGIDVGRLVRRLGGGGHPGAGSAMVKSATAEEVYGKVTALLKEFDRPQIRVKEIMSKLHFHVAPGTSMTEARLLLARRNLHAVAVVEEDKFVGVISDVECGKAQTESQRKAPVKAFMKTTVPVTSPEQSVQEALRLMSESDAGLLPVIEGGRIVGVVTRADLMFHIYEF